MAKIFSGSQVFEISDNVIDKQAMIDKVKAAQSGQNVPGVVIIDAHYSDFTGKALSESTGSGSLITVALVAVLAFILFKF